MATPLFPLPPDVLPRLAGSPLVLMLDVDGTLAAIAPRPEEAVVPAETRRVVAALAARPDVAIAIVSGRAAPDARRMVGVANVWVIGNHGAEVISPDGEVSIDPQVEGYQRRMATAARTLEAQLARVPGVVLEDKTWTLSIHYRLADPGVVPRLKGAVEEAAIDNGLRVTHGKMVLEVRPPVSVDKGTAVFSLARALGGLAEDASLLFAGDDRTDEDAFRMLRARDARPVTVRVTLDPEAPTAAEFTLPDPTAVRQMLEWLAAERGITLLDPRRRSGGHDAHRGEQGERDASRSPDSPRSI